MYAVHCTVNHTHITLYIYIYSGVLHAAVIAISLGEVLRNILHVIIMTHYTNGESHMQRVCRTHKYTRCIPVMMPI